MRWGFLAGALLAGILFTAQSAPHVRADIGPTASVTGAQNFSSVTTAFVDAGVVWLGDGTASVPTMSFSSDPDTGLYWLSANSLCATTGANVRGCYDSAGLTLYNSGIFKGTAVSNGAGTAASPSYTFTTDTNTGLYSVDADQLGVSIAGVRSFNFSATAGKLEGISGIPSLTLDDSAGAKLAYTGSSIRAATNTVLVSGSAGFDITAGTPFTIASKVVLSGATPTISSGFGTSPSVTAGYSTAFRVNVGTGGVATTGVIAIPGAAATTGWNCSCTDITTHVGTCQQTASTTTTASFGQFVSAGTAQAWAASDVLAVTCVGL